MIEGVLLNAVASQLTLGLGSNPPQLDSASTVRRRSLLSRMIASTPIKNHRPHALRAHAIGRRMPSLRLWRRLPIG